MKVHEKLNTHKFLKIFYLTISNLVLFYCIHKLFFLKNIFGIPLNFLLSLSCLNFAVVNSYESKFLEKKQIWYLISEWVLGFLLISIFTKLFFIRSLEHQSSYWISVFIASLLGGILSVINHNKTFKSKTDLKKYSVYLILLTLLFPLTNYLFFKFGYKRIFYDLSFPIIVPEIIIVLMWQIFNLLNILKNKPSKI